MNFKQSMIVRYTLATLMIIAGATTSYLGIGGRADFPFGGVGTYLIVVAVIIVLINASMQIFNWPRRKDREPDERELYVAAQAGRITLALTVLSLFLVMIIDGYVTITLPYHLGASYFLSGVMLIYVIAYKAMVRP